MRYILVTAVQTEYSLFERTVEEAGIVKILAEIGIGFVAYSPLSRGFLNGQIKTPEDFPENDFRKTIPRFQGENFYKNLKLVHAIQQIASAKGITASQLALAWVMAKGAVAIPGTKRIKYIEENIAAAQEVLTDAEMLQLENIVPPGISTGDRYDAYSMTMIDK